jgi:hypothetical protein
MSMPAPPGSWTASPAPAPKPRPKRWPWILGMVVSLFVGIGIGAAATTSETTETRTEGSPVTTLPPAEGAQPEPTSSPTLANGQGASLNEPIPVGSAAHIGDWKVQVVGYSPNATDAVHRENQFNEKPGSGEQYVLVTLRTTYEGPGSSDLGADQTWSVVSDGTLYEEAGQVWPDDLSNANKVPSGASAVGNVGFLVKSSDVRGLTLYVEAYTPDFETEGAFLALGG